MPRMLHLEPDTPLLSDEAFVGVDEATVSAGYITDTLRTNILLATQHHVVVRAITPEAEAMFAQKL